MLCCSEGAAKIAIHEKMTEDELTFYFGETSYDKIGSMYDVGLLKKVKKPDNLLTRVLGTSDPREEYEFKAFGMDVSLKMEKNKLLMSRRANIVYVGADGKEDRRNVNESTLNCHMLHRGENLVAAVSSCFDGQLSGFISTEKDTFEISPLTDRLKQILSLFRNPEFADPLEIDDGVLVDDLYIVKRATFPNFTMDDTQEIDYWYNDDDAVLDIDFPIDSDVQESPDSEGNENKMIEAAIFFDHVAYNRFSKIYSDDEIESLIMAYVNQVAALYQVSSLGQRVDIMITYLEIQREQRFDTHEGKREEILQSFCEYNNGLKPDDDEGDPRHWDIGILVSGLDLWLEKNGVRNYDILGVARTRGMCHSKYSCAAGQFFMIS